MASDIKLNDNSVILEGNVGVGTNSPFRRLHVEGSEIHTGGPASGFSFDDRTQGNGKRWVWYAEGDHARLWSQGVNKLSISSIGDVFVERDLYVANKLRVTDDLRVNSEGKIFGRLGGTEYRGGHRLIRCLATAISLDPPNSPIEANSKIAFASELTINQKDSLVVNYQQSFKDGVPIEGNVQVTGVLTQASSILLKENVAELSAQEAMATLQGLNAVKYNYKADEKKEQRIGFIAEDVPDLVASEERDRLSSMDIVAVLTKAVQEQQKTIAQLAAEVSALKGHK
jgi:hypothetical protein